MPRACPYLCWPFPFERSTDSDGGHLGFGSIKEAKYRHYTFLQQQASWIICVILCITKRKREHATLHFKLIWRIHRCPSSEVFARFSNYTELGFSAQLPASSPLHPPPQCLRWCPQHRPVGTEPTASGFSSLHQSNSFTG